MNRTISIILLIVFTAGLACAQNMSDMQAISRALDKRKMDLDMRERNIKAQEQRIKTMESSLLQKDVQIRKIQADVTARLKEIKVQEDKNLDKLAKDYVSARPKNAALVIVKMDIDKAMQLFQRLPAMTAGNIISAMGPIDPVYAAQLSEKFTPQKIPSVTGAANGQ